MAKKISIFSSKKVTLVLFLFFSINLFAQLPANMSNIRSKDISDVQLQEFIKKAGASGLSESQFQDELLKRGMNPGEVAILKNRISQATAVPSSTPNPVSEPRVSNSPNDKANTTYNANYGGAILGAELFSNPTLSFEPDLRIATPKNYVLGILCIALGFCAFLWNQRFNSKAVQFSTHRYLTLMTLCFSVSGIMQWYNLKTYDGFAPCDFPPI